MWFKEKQCLKFDLHLLLRQSFWRKFIYDHFKVKYIQQTSVSRCNHCTVRISKQSNYTTLKFLWHCLQILAHKMEALILNLNFVVYLVFWIYDDLWLIDDEQAKKACGRDCGKVVNILAFTQAYRVRIQFLFCNLFDKNA